MKAIDIIEKRMGKQPEKLDLSKLNVQELANILKEKNPLLVEFIKSEYPKEPTNRITFEEWMENNNA